MANALFGNIISSHNPQLRLFDWPFEVAYSSLFVGSHQSPCYCVGDVVVSSWSMIDAFFAAACGAPLK
jgi:hypothetical protein